MSLVEKIKQMDLEKWVHENCIYKGKSHSAHYCLELFRRKVVLKILAVHEEKQTIVELDEFLKELKEQGVIVVEREKLQELSELLKNRQRLSLSEFHGTKEQCLNQMRFLYEKWFEVFEKKFGEMEKEEK